MSRLGILLLIVVAGGVILCPVIMAFEPDPLPGDFAFTWNNQHFAVPVLWSLCASGVLALLYSFLRR
jgi:hypothetical protein